MSDEHGWPGGWSSEPTADHPIHHDADDSPIHAAEPADVAAGTDAAETDGTAHLHADPGVGTDVGLSETGSPATDPESTGFAPTWAGDAVEYEPAEPGWWAEPVTAFDLDQTGDLAPEPAGFLDPFAEPNDPTPLADVELPATHDGSNWLDPDAVDLAALTHTPDPGSTDPIAFEWDEDQRADPLPGELAVASWWESQV